jgi:peptidoglycan/xylan/chitin deacetylase (PgdA/CDA1 family)
LNKFPINQLARLSRRKPVVENPPKLKMRSRSLPVISNVKKKGGGMDNFSITMVLSRYSTYIRRLPAWLAALFASMRPRVLPGTVILLAASILSGSLVPAQAAAGILSLTSGIPATGVIGLLLPDGLSTSNRAVGAWLNAAREEGLRIETLTDSQFLALGTGANAYRGMILPDNLHVVATDDLVAALEGYVNRGGQAMLVYDFGALNADGFYAVPKSRLSLLAGVDYVLYDELLDRTVGLGPITGFESMLRKMQVPPGKSIPFVVSATTTLAAKTTRNVAAMQGGVVPAAASAAQSGVLQMAGLDAGQALYLPVGARNPGGLRGYNHAQQFKADPIDRHVMVRTADGPVASKTPPSEALLRSAASVVPPITFATAKKLPEVSDPTPRKGADTPLSSTSSKTMALVATPAIASADNVHAISGYIYGNLVYPSFVTRGLFAGTQLANSPQFGLVAGVNSLGSGKVLFVNTPLTYLKGSTDGMLMHGLLRYFSSDMLKLPRLSSLPNALPGLTLNWHLCSNFTADMAQLTSQGVFQKGPFSIHITAGPDTVSFGDRLGWNLPLNPQAQQMLRDLDARGHNIGNHGGWIHDYYGDNASEGNQATFEQYLVLNKNVVDAVLGHATVEYAAPQGNSPSWAMNWLEKNGFVGTYYLGGTGMGPTRNYSDGVLKNPGLWVNPVMPFGLYATFEEFIEFNVPKQSVIDWYTQLTDFSIQNRTNRLIYMHPPGAAQWSDVVLGMLAYANTQQQAGKFAWYTIFEIDTFMTARNKVAWDESVTSAGVRNFTATHPTSLAKMSWLLPKAAFAKPVVISGTATVSDGGDSWVVVATRGKSLNFSATPI